MSDDKIVHLTNSNFDQEIQSGLTLVDFWAEWCGPCLALAPTISEIASNYDGKIKVGKVNVDHSQDVSARYGIRGIPTIILFKDGEQADIFTGNNPQKIKEMVDRALVVN